MRKGLAVAVLVSSQIVWAQMAAGTRVQVLTGDTILDRRIQQDAFEKWAMDPQGSKKRVEAAREADANREFYAKAQQFVQLWETFAAQLNEKKTFNAKLAKQVSKAFHELEKSEGWPVGRQK